MIFSKGPLMLIIVLKKISSLEMQSSKLDIGSGAGTVSNNSAISKRNSINAFQNAITFLQVQADGLRQAEKIHANACPKALDGGR